MEGDRLDRYIQNLLDMTRLGHTGLSLNRDWIGVDELIGSATGRLRRYQPDVALRVERRARAAAGLGASGAGRTGLVQRAGERGEILAAGPSDRSRGAARGRRPRIGSRAVAAGRRARPGPGIPEERKRIFDMFYNVERGDRGHGTGMGLTIAQGMVGAHGGGVEALPAPGGQEHAGAHDLAADDAEATGLPTEATTTPARVLVIDDEPQIRRFLDISLRAQN